MKKLIIILLMLISASLNRRAEAQLYLNDNQVKINTQLYGQVEYDAIMVGFDSPSTMNPDTLWFCKNKTGAVMTIDSIRVESSTDDQDISVVSRNWQGGGSTLVDAVTASTNGTNMFYSTETTISDASIAANQTLGIKKPTVASSNVQLTIYYHYTKQKR